jgi:hypothetical protein
MPGKRVQFDGETLHALTVLARDRMQDFQELADEAFRDLLHKHGRPTDLKTALRQSVSAEAHADGRHESPVAALIHAVQSGNDNHATAIKKGKRSHAATGSSGRPSSKSPD